MSNVAFNNKQSVKDEFVYRAKSHKDAGRIRQETYGEWVIDKPGTAEFKGCALGCLAQPIKYAEFHNGFEDEYAFEDWAEENDADISLIMQEDIENNNRYSATFLKETGFSTELCACIEAIFETASPDFAQNVPLKIVEEISTGANVSGEVIQRIVDNSDNLRDVLNDRFDYNSRYDDRVTGILGWDDDDILAKPDPEGALEDLLDGIKLASE